MSEQKCGLDDAFASGMTLADVERCIVKHLPQSEPEWEQPVPLDDPTGPPFPLEALPGMVGTYVAAVAEESQTPPDVAAIVALGTISAAAGGKYEAVIPEHGWREPVHIQAVAVAEPANRKSGIFRLMSGPISEYERDVKPGERRALSQWESRGRSLEKALASAENAATKAAEHGTLTNAEAIRMAAVEALEEHRAQRPRITRIITDDATPEAVKSLLAEQGAIAAMSGESAFLSNTAGGRYSNSPNIDVLLNGHAGDSIRVDRKGRPSEVVDRACLTLCLMVQPQVIRDLGNAPGFVTRGGAARLLTCFPVDNLGHRRIDVTPVPLELAEGWSEMITTIVKRRPSLQEGAYVPWSLSLDIDASQVFRDYRVLHEPKMASEGALSDIRDWGGKQCGAVLRIAGLLHVTAHTIPESVPISADTVRRAITIMEYFEQHARILYRQLRGHGGHGAAQQVLKVIRNLAAEEGHVTRADVRKAMRGRTAFARAADLDAPLALLEEYGWIRVMKLETGGRPSDLILLNPLKSMPERPESFESDVFGLSGMEMELPDPSPADVSGLFGMNSQPGDPLDPTPTLENPFVVSGTDRAWRMEL